MEFSIKGGSGVFFQICQNLFTLSLGIRYIHIVIVTRNMAEYTSSWQSAARAAEECQYCRCRCASSISDLTNFCNGGGGRQTVFETFPNLAPKIEPLMWYSMIHQRMDLAKLLPIICNDLWNPDFNCLTLELSRRNCT